MVAHPQLCGSLATREYRPEDLGSVLRLMELALGPGPAGRREEGFWQWKHCANPFGSSLALVASNHGEEIVGLRALMRWQFRTGGRVVRAARAVDTATHPDYRRIGVFSTLSRRAMEQARTEGVELIFNTPNSIVLPGYLKLGWQRVATVHPLVKVLNYRRFVWGLTRSWLGRATARVYTPAQFFRQEPTRAAEVLGHAGFEGIAQQAWQREDLITTHRSTGYLQWRYGEHPCQDYFAVFQEQRGEALGCLLFRANTRFNLKEVILDEMLLAKPDRRLALSLVDEMKRHLAADYIIAYFAQGSFQRRVLASGGFHQLPRVGMNFVVNVLGDHLPLDPARWSNWNLSLGDLEVF